MNKVSYPPCEHCNCTGNRCSGEIPGMKFEWPELIGADEIKAKATITKENPTVFVMSIYPGVYIIPDICCNRVVLYLDRQHGIVTQKPIVG
ncbi:hypothetical protein Leryth_023467 [Lithospermum erythrorhizon]|uniref:Uncharacterized protein n=1 Tax=Lithospermum erythrorhizon TaxID=34254 RepID=A0AAV3QN32_LITER|nr:hypothetical protein Leryth_023467 [Lithospermum erythrorhizon]